MNRLKKLGIIGLIAVFFLGGFTFAGELIRTLKNHKSTVSSIAFSPDGTKIASGSHDDTIKLWDAQNGKLLNTLKGHKNDVLSVAFSPDGTTIASGGRDRTIKLWDAQSGKLLNTLKGHKKEIFSKVISVVFSPDGNMIASGSGGGNNTIKLWDAQSGKLLNTLKDYKEKISSKVISVVFSPDSTTIASGSSGSYDKTIKLWDVQSGKLFNRLKGHKDNVLSVAFSPDGTTIASGSGDSTIKLWDAQSGKLFYTLKGHKRDVYSVAFSPDGTMIASGSRDNTIKLWDAQSGKLFYTLKGHKGDVRGVAFSPDGTMIVSRSYDKTIKLWDASSCSKPLVNKVYKSIDKSDYIALYEFTKKFSDKFSVVQKALQAVTNTVSRKNSIETMRYISGTVQEPLGVAVAERIIELEKNKHTNIYNLITQKNTISGYLWFMRTYPKSKNFVNAKKSLYSLIKKENNIAAYRWFSNISLINTSKESTEALREITKLMYTKAKELDSVSSYAIFVQRYPLAKEAVEAIKRIYSILFKKAKEKNTVIAYNEFVNACPLAPQVEEANKKIYSILFEKAKEKNTIIAYNEFVYACPLASQVKEANKKAYELEKEKYTDIGMLGFVGKDEKMNKQARKLLIEVKKIMDTASSGRNNLTFRNIGYFIVVGRMYELTRSELGDTDAALTLQESVNIDKFKKRNQDFMDNMIKKKTADHESIVKMHQNIINQIRKSVGNIYADKRLMGFYNTNGKKVWGKLLSEDKIKTTEFLREMKQKEKKVKEKRNKELQEKINSFEKLYQKSVSEYKSEFRIGRNVSISKATGRALSQNRVVQEEEESGSKSVSGKNLINSNSNFLSEQKVQQQAQSHISTSNQLTDDERQELEQLRAEKAKVARKKEANSNMESGTEFKPKDIEVESTAPEVVTSEPADQNQTITNNNSTHTDGSKAYYARISQRDHYGKSGQKLKGVGIILQQDRANYHKYHKRDREDTGDNRFGTRDNRNKIKRMLARGSTSQKTLDAIRYGTPLVKVKIYPEYIDVTLESGGDQTQQRQEKKNSTQTRQSKSKKSKCSTEGSIRGISRSGDGFVAVRKGPGTKYGMIGKIYRNGTSVKICDRKGKWKGVIYGDCIADSSRSPNGSCKAGWVYEKYIKSVGSALKKSNNLTNSEKLSLLDQLLNVPNRDMLKYAKVSIRDFLKKESNPNMINNSYETYKHTCVQVYSDHFKCKFGAYFDNGEDEAATVVEYDAVRKNNKVKINKIYPVMMAD